MEFKADKTLLCLEKYYGKVFDGKIKDGVFNVEEDEDFEYSAYFLESIKFILIITVGKKLNSLEELNNLIHGTVQEIINNKTNESKFLEEKLNIPYFKNFLLDLSLSFKVFDKESEQKCDVDHMLANFKKTRDKMNKIKTICIGEKVKQSVHPMFLRLFQKGVDINFGNLKNINFKNQSLTNICAGVVKFPNTCQKLCVATEPAQFSGSKMGTLDLSATTINSIPAGAFRGLEVGELILPKGLQKIEPSAFSGAIIGTLTFPENCPLEKLPDNAFNGANVGEVNLGKHLNEVGPDVFVGATIERLKFNAECTLRSFPNRKSFEKSGSLREIIFPQNLETIGNSAFYESGVRSVTFPPGSKLVQIGPHAFQGNKIKVLKLPEGLLSMGSYAFEGNHIEEVHFGPCLKTIADRTFENNNLKKVALPPSVKSMGNNTFAGNSILKKFVIPPDSELTDVGFSCFKETDIEELFVPKGLSSLDAFGGIEKIVMHTDASVSFLFNLNGAKEVQVSNAVNAQELDDYMKKNPNTKIIIPEDCAALNENSCFLESLLKTVEKKQKNNPESVILLNKKPNIGTDGQALVTGTPLKQKILQQLKKSKKISQEPGQYAEQEEIDNFFEVFYERLKINNLDEQEKIVGASKLVILGILNKPRVLYREKKLASDLIEIIKGGALNHGSESTLKNLTELCNEIADFQSEDLSINKLRSLLNEKIPVIIEKRSIPAFSWIVSIINFIQTIFGINRRENVITKLGLNKKSLSDFSKNSKDERTSAADELAESTDANSKKDTPEKKVKAPNDLASKTPSSSSM